MFSGARKVAERHMRDGKGRLYAIRITFEVSDDRRADTTMAVVTYTGAELQAITNPDVSSLERHVRARRLASPWVEAVYRAWVESTDGGVAESIADAIFREA